LHGTEPGRTVIIRKEFGLKFSEVQTRKAGMKDQDLWKSSNKLDLILAFTTYFHIEVPNFKAHQTQWLDDEGTRSIKNLVRR
tara:strand:- start:425 stop:670 length:246 start_codon:yes stop_codon:yes gene_type:complete